MGKSGMISCGEMLVVMAVAVTKSELILALALTFPVPTFSCKSALALRLLRVLKLLKLNGCLAKASNS